MWFGVQAERLRLRWACFPGTFSEQAVRDLLKFPHVCSPRLLPTCNALRPFLRIGGFPSTYTHKARPLVLPRARSQPCLPSPTCAHPPSPRALAPPVAESWEGLVLHLLLWQQPTRGPPADSMLQARGRDLG